MGKTLQIKISSAIIAVLFLVFSYALFSARPVEAFDERATPTMLNRTVIALGDPSKAQNIFYDKDSSNDAMVWQNVTDGCPSDIALESQPVQGGSINSWVLRSSKKLSDGTCSPEKKTTLPTPKDYSDRKDTVFYRDASDAIHSVKADLTLDFVNTGLSARGNVAAIYIEKDVDPFSCPSLIVDQKSPDGWAYVIMERSESAEKASDEYDALIKDLGVSGYFGSTDLSDFNDICKAAGDVDSKGNLEKIGLPESYFNAGVTKSNYEEVTFGYPGAAIGSVDIHQMFGPNAAGMALAGPLQGGFITSGELEAGSQSSGSNDPVCSAGALGFVICPAMSLMVDVIEWVAGTLEGYLAFNPFAGSNNDIKRIWSSLLNIANSLLVVAFLVVVFSQSTSVGLSNYGIKRMLPRIIAAAILMNLSYYICQILVDLSNIAGVGVTGLISATTNGTFADNVAQVSDLGRIVVGAGIIAIVGFFFLIPVMLAFLAIIFTIAARNALIVLLVIIAPLAFAAWIFPNTEKYFKKWWELLINLLLLFPLVMLMFSASVVAANVISSATPPSGTGGQELQGLIALLVLALPLFAMPFLFKVAGGALSKISALTKQGMNQYGGKQSAEFTKGLRQNTVRNTGARLASNKFGLDSEGNRRGVSGKLGALGAGVGGYNARRKFRMDSKKSDSERLQQDSIAQRLQDTDSNFAARSTLRGETGQAIARARGVAIQDKMVGEEMGAAKTLIENAGLTNAQLSELGVGGKAYARDKNGQIITDANGNKKVALAGDLYQKSAASQLISSGQVGHVYKMLANAENMSDDVRASMEYNLSQNYSILKAKDHTLNDDSIKTALLQNGGKISADQYQTAAISKMSGLTKEVLAGQDAAGLEHLRAAITNGVGKPEERDKALRLIHETMEDPLLAGKMTAESEKAFQAILQDAAYTSYSSNINQQPPSGSGP